MSQRVATFLRVWCGWLDGAWAGLPHSCSLLITFGVSNKNLISLSGPLVTAEMQGDWKIHIVGWPCKALCDTRERDFYKRGHCLLKRETEHLRIRQPRDTSSLALQSIWAFEQSQSTKFMSREIQAMARATMCGHARADQSRCSPCPRSHRSWRERNATAAPRSLYRCVRVGMWCAYIHSVHIYCKCGRYIYITDFG